MALAHNYAEVNASPLVGVVPTPEEAIRGARLLLAEGFRLHDKRKLNRKWMFRITSGNRQTRPSVRGVFMVNPDEAPLGGWAEIVHSISHHVHHRVNPRLSGHQFHAFTEERLVAYAIARGFHLGALKRKPRAAKDPVAVKRAALAARLKGWTTKAKRADTAIRKITAQIKRLDKKASA